jgi:tetratricopeptide (TPR) repeat protein
MSNSAGSTLEERLLHPRRSLGDRYRTQAERFLSSGNEGDAIWGEQMASKAVLYDFTNPRNWKTLVKSRIKLGDEHGVSSALKDLFSVLGRDPNLTDMLKDVDMLIHGASILAESLRIDPLDPDEWWALENPIDNLLEKIRSLDFSDPRANLLFSRRLERALDNGFEEEYLEHATILLAQRPMNHEAWTKLGKIHERRGSTDEAWHCYDQAQVSYPSCEERDRFIERMGARMDGSGSLPWKKPPIESRAEFLEGMRLLAGIESNSILERDEVTVTANPIRALMDSGRLNEAFFLARRRAAEGDLEAEHLMNEISEAIQ